jgi:hypothetical protein
MENVYHDFEHKIALVADHVKNARKALAPFYTTDAGVDVHRYLIEATAVLDQMDSTIFHRLLNKEG